MGIILPGLITQDGKGETQASDPCLSRLRARGSMGGWERPVAFNQRSKEDNPRRRAALEGHMSAEACQRIQKAEQAGL